MKTKKYKIIISVVLVAVLVGAAWYAGRGKNMPAQTTANNTVEIKKSAGQEVVIAKITSIKGNEITYVVAEEVNNEEPQGERQSFGEGERSFSGGQMPDMSQMPDRGSEDRGEMPSRDSQNRGEMPSRDSQDRGEMPSRAGQSRGEISSRTGQGRGETNQFTYDNKTYRIGNENITTYIPVGTDVTTKLGTVTTFSRLAVDDYLALVMEKDGNEEVIAAVYIIG